jgi:hypothetical protein
MVFNNLGQIVETILDESLDKGDHQVTWNTEDLPSGIYFYRISTIDHRPLTIDLRPSKIGKLVLK